MAEAIAARRTISLRSIGSALHAAWLTISSMADVILVLLIIFLITIPVVTHTVQLTLPKETNIAVATKPENINISVNKDGDIFWNQTLVPDADALFVRLSKIATL